MCSLWTAFPGVQTMARLAVTLAVALLCGALASTAHAGEKTCQNVFEEHYNFMCVVFWGCTLVSEAAQEIFQRGTCCRGLCAIPATRRLYQPPGLLPVPSNRQRRVSTANLMWFMRAA